MSAAGVLFAAAVAAVVAIGVWMEVAWRGHARPGASRLRRAEVVRVVVAAVAAAAISVAGALAVLAEPAGGGVGQGPDPLVGYLALVGLATVVGTVGAGPDPSRASAVGLGLGAPPALVVIAVALAIEADAFWLLAVGVAAVAGGAVSAAVWVLTVLARWDLPTLRRLTGTDRQAPGRAR